MSDRKIRLKPCPFCGAPEYQDERVQLRVAANHKDRCAVVCQCGATGPIVKSEETAVTAWNARDYSTQHPPWNPFRFSDKVAALELKGRLEALGLPAILQVLTSEKKTGVLQFTQGKTRRAICLKDGNIVAASGTELPRLGQMLFNKGLISQKRLEKALTRAKQSKKRLGDVLLELGYIGEDTLKNLVRDQILEAVLDISLRGGGDFEYRDCEVEFGQGAMADVNTIGLLLETARILDEQAAVSGKAQSETRPEVLQERGEEQKARKETVEAPLRKSPPITSGKANWARRAVLLTCLLVAILLSGYVLLFSEPKAGFARFWDFHSHQDEKEGSSLSPTSVQNAKAQEIDEAQLAAASHQSQAPDLMPRSSSGASAPSVRPGAEEKSEVAAGAQRPADHTKQVAADGTPSDVDPPDEAAIADASSGADHTEQAVPPDAPSSAGHAEQLVSADVPVRADEVEETATADSWPLRYVSVAPVANVRTGPDIHARILTKITLGTEVNVVEAQGEWMKITLPDDRFGWIYRPLLEKVAANSPGSVDG